MDLFRNLEHFSAVAASHGKSVRIATKSVRVLELLRRVQSRVDLSYEGLMCFSALEAAWLASAGFDNLLIAYPTVESHELRAVFKAIQQSM